MFSTKIIPVFFIVNILAGVLFISKKRHVKRVFVSFLFIAILLYILSYLFTLDENLSELTNFVMLFLFYSIVTYEIIAQVWQSKEVNTGVMLGLMSGYISLGLVGFFICMSVEFLEPGSFSGLTGNDTYPHGIRDDLGYFSFITLLTIGYGDILPISQVARNAAVIIGLLGQFYLVIVTAVVIEKYIRHSGKTE